MNLVVLAVRGGRAGRVRNILGIRDHRPGGTAKVVVCHPEERSDEGSLIFKNRDPSLRSG